VHPLSEKNNVQSGSRRTRAPLLIRPRGWGLEGVTYVYGIRNGRHSNPMLPCQGMFIYMGESSFSSILSFSSNSTGDLHTPLRKSHDRDLPSREPLLQLAIDLQLGYTIIFNREAHPQVPQRKYLLLESSIK
jgi:hypothetical protein